MKQWLIGVAAGATLVAVAIPAMLEGPAAPTALEPSPATALSLRASTRSSAASIAMPRSPAPSENHLDARPASATTRVDLDTAERRPHPRRNALSASDHRPFLERLEQRTKDGTITDADIARLVRLLQADHELAAQVAILLRNPKSPIGHLRGPLVLAGIASGIAPIVDAINASKRTASPLPNNEFAVTRALHERDPTQLVKNIRMVPNGMLKKPAVFNRIVSLALDVEATDKTRIAAVRTLGRAKSAEAASTLIRVYENSSGALRHSAVRRLGNCPPSDETRRIFFDALDGDETLVAKRHAALGLNKDSSDQATRALVRALRHPDPDLRGAAITGLALRMGRPWVRAALETARRRESTKRLRTRLGRILR